MDEVHGQAELLISKQRHGPTGNIRLSFESKFTRFGNYISNEQIKDYGLILQINKWVNQKN